MYNIQGERKGEVGDNETLKTVDFRYPFHELDAERKMQLADAKAKAKAKEADDKELNKAANWMPKLSKWNTPYIADASNREVNKLFGDYSEKRKLLVNNRDLAGIQYLKAETEAKARNLENNLNRQQELYKNWDENLKTLQTDPNVDPYQFKLLKQKHEGNINDFIKNNPDELFKADHTVFTAMDDDIRSKSFVIPDAESQMSNRIKQGAQKITEEISPNDYGGVSSTKYKLLMDQQRNGIFNSEFNNPDNMNYFAKQYNTILEKNNKPIMTREELFKDKGFIDYAKATINDRIDANFASETTRNMSVNPRDAVGNGQSLKANWDDVGVKTLESVDESVSNEKTGKIPSAIVVSLTDKANKPLKVQLSDVKNETGQTREYTEAQQSKMEELDNRIKKAKGAEKTKLEKEKEAIIPTGKVNRSSGEIQINNAGFSLGASRSGKLTHDSTIREALKLPASRSGNTDIVELKADIDAAFPNKKDRLEKYKELVTNYELYGITTGSSAVSNKSSKGSKTTNFEEFGTDTEGQSTSTKSESKTSVYGSPLNFLKEIKLRAGAKPNDTKFKRLDDNYNAWNTMQQESRNVSGTSTTNAKEVKKTANTPTNTNVDRSVLEEWKTKVPTKK